MTTEVLGSMSFLEIPTVAGAPVLLNAGGVPSLQSGTFAGRPAAGNVGNLYIDTTNNLFYRDNGTTWDTISASTSYVGTTNEIGVAGNVIGLADNPIVPGTARMRLPVGTTAQRPGSPVAGDVRYNSTLGLCEKYTGAYWGPFGLVLQVVTGTIATGNATGTIPLDNTTPAVGEGNSMWSQSFTPMSATSRIIISFAVTVSSSNNSNSIITALFAGSTNIGSTISRINTANAGYPAANIVVHQPGSTATITYSCRYGGQGNTSYVNSTSGANLGGSMVSQFSIVEIE